MKNKLIEIYLLVRRIYDMNNHLHLQDNRNNLPTMTIPEPMTIYLFGNLKKEETKSPTKKEPEADEEENWSKDQREKSYYYDDSHGYEIYNPDDDDEEDDE